LPFFLVFFFLQLVSLSLLSSATLQALFYIMVGLLLYDKEGWEHNLGVLVF